MNSYEIVMFLLGGVPNKKCKNSYVEVMFFVALEHVFFLLFFGRNRASVSASSSAFGLQNKGPIPPSISVNKTDFRGLIPGTQNALASVLNILCKILEFRIVCISAPKS